jgi:hypothetical protein
MAEAEILDYNLHEKVLLLSKKQLLVVQGFIRQALSTTSIR